MFSPVAQQPLVGQGLLIIENSRLHSDTPHSVTILRTRDEPDAETSDNAQHSRESDNYLPAGFEPKFSGSERSQTHALDSAVTEIC
jgi:hypothetical protein